MIEAPQIIETTKQLTAYIHLTIPREEIRHVMEPGLNEVMGVLADQGVEPSGPWFTHHLRLEPGIFDFEICVPVETRIQPAGRVQAGEWAAMEVARTIYQGPYGGLAGAWKEFNEWISANGHAPAEDLFERYVSSPPSAARTELNRPLVTKGR